MSNPTSDEHGAMFVTADSEDPRFNETYIDVREWRDEPADAPVFAGGITTQQEIDQLDALRMDAVVGMALYAGRISA